MPLRIFYLFLGTFIFCNINIEKVIAQSFPWTKSTLLFEDTGKNNWQEKWMLDGTKSKVINSEKGLELIAGPEHGNDTCHTVLWTKQSFNGNICIEYDYTKTDTTTRCVNIIYFHATGKGTANYPADISLWNNRRTVPHMYTYFNNMHTYHISYAAFSANKYSANNDYIRLRRYLPSKKSLNGTNALNSYEKTDLFKPNQTYHIQVFKYDNQVVMHIQNTNINTEQLTCRWDVSKFPDCNQGRIGFRHMYTRSTRYKNIKVWQLK